MIKKEDVFKIGQFTKPHGVKGELALVTRSDVFDESDDPYIVCDIEGILVPFFIEEYRYKTDSVILVKLEYVDTEEAAREFVHREVYYPLEEMGEKEWAEEATWDSFIGYTVTDLQYGELGCIVDVDTSTINVLLKIDRDGQELLFPAADELITDADATARRLTVSLPEGLLDL